MTVLILKEKINPKHPKILRVRCYGAEGACLRAAKRGKKINPLTGRMAEHYECAECHQLFPLKQVCKDHILPVVDTVRGFVDWNTYIERMFCAIDKWQIICRSCHDVKSAQERKDRKCGTSS